MHCSVNEIGLHDYSEVYMQACQCRDILYLLQTQSDFQGNTLFNY